MQHKAFHEKRIVQLDGREFLQACDSSALADFDLSYERIGQLKPFPADRGALDTLAIAVAAPALPVISHPDAPDLIFEDLLKALH
jgi:hypothetical protein